jgi:hypothetical protein
VECHRRREAVASNPHATLVAVPSLPRGVSLLRPLWRPTCSVGWHRASLPRVGDIGCPCCRRGMPLPARGRREQSTCNVGRCAVTSTWRLSPPPPLFVSYTSAYVLYVVSRSSLSVFVYFPARAVAILCGPWHYCVQRWCALYC